MFHSWRGRYDDLKARHKQMTTEVGDLRYVVAGLFNAVPELFSTLDPGRLRNIGFIPQTASHEVAPVSANAQPQSSCHSPLDLGDERFVFLQCHTPSLKECMHLSVYLSGSQICVYVCWGGGGGAT